MQRLILPLFLPHFDNVYLIFWLFAPRLLDPEIPVAESLSSKMPMLTALLPGSEDPCHITEGIVIVNLIKVNRTQVQKRVVSKINSSSHSY